MGPKKGKKDLKNHEDDRGKRLAKKITDLNKEDKNSEGAKKDKTKKKKTSFTLPEKGKKIFYLFYHCVYDFWQYLRVSVSEKKGR